MRTALAAIMPTVLAVLAPAQFQFAEMGRRHLPEDTDSTAAMALGDVDGDGDLDLVVGNRFGASDRLYLNDGAGVFTDNTAWHLPAFSSDTTSLALADCDGDGDLDVIVGGSQQNRLYLNSGTGTFVDATWTRMPVRNDYTRALASGDVDGDGDLDLILGNGFGQQNSLYLNDGAGTFTDATAARLPLFSDDTTALALGDIDGDGDLDLLVGNSSWLGSAQNRLYLNDGAGTFTDATAARLPVFDDDTAALGLGDIDGDGDLDVLVGNRFGERTRLYSNDGTGTFTDASVARLPTNTDLTVALALADVDGDGDLDLILGNYFPGQQCLYSNDGTGHFTDATAAQLPASSDRTGAMVVGDVDGDGDPDLMVGNEEQDHLSLNDGTGTFIDATAQHLQDLDRNQTQAVALGDVDGDGDLDLIVGNGGSPAAIQNRLLLNAGSGNFTDVTAVRLPALADSTNAVVLGDVDGDGDLDLIVGNLGQNRLHLNDGAGRFSDATAAHMPVSNDQTAALAIGDVDGDGDLDLVVGDRLQQDRLLLNDGTGTFTDASATHMPIDTDWTGAVALGDVDDDGDLDLITGNGTLGFGQQNRLCLNDGTGRFTDNTLTRMPVDSDPSEALALGDLDGDGDLDMIVGAPARLYLNDGTGRFTDATLTHGLRVPGSTASLVLGDVDGDGDLDLVVGNGRDGRNRLFLNDGSGSFTDATLTRLPYIVDWTSSQALGDVDGDGDLDLVVGNREWRENHLYLNLLRQLDAPYLLRPGRAWRLDAYARGGTAAPGDFVLPFFSFIRANIPVPALGTIGIDPQQMIALPPISIAQPDGVGTLPLSIPALAALAGLRVYVQAILLRPAAPPSLTNVVADRLVR